MHHAVATCNGVEGAIDSYIANQRYVYISKRLIYRIIPSRSVLTSGIVNGGVVNGIYQKLQSNHAVAAVSILQGINQGLSAWLRDVYISKNPVSWIVQGCGVLAGGVVNGNAVYWVYRKSQMYHAVATAYATKNGIDLPIANTRNV